MEYILFLFFVLILGYLFGNLIYPNILKTKSFITKIDDKNFIINDEFVSFKEDAPFLKFKQKQEDNKHYKNYERNKLNYDSKYLVGIYDNFKKYIVEYPKEILEITKTEILNNKIKYGKYILKCKKLNISTLTKEEYSLLWRYGFLVHVSGCFISTMYLTESYTIYNEETAKYSKGNMKEIIEKEFKKKWY